jgi:hypothetical protein
MNLPRTKLKPAVAKTVKNASLLSLLLGTMGSNALADTDTLTFSGTCKIHDQSFPPEYVLATFSVAAEEPGLESETVEFRAPGVDGHNEYLLRAEFFRRTQGEHNVTLSLGWDAEGGRSHTRATVALEKGKNLYFEYEYKPASRIYCSGTIN